MKQLNAFRVFRVVFVKELVDALRDKRTFIAMAVMALMAAPLLLFVMSKFANEMEAKSERRTVYAVGMEHSPQLRNFLQRRNWTVQAPPADYEAQLRASTFQDPVLVVPEDFDADVVAGKRPDLKLVSDGANRQSGFGVGPVSGLLRAYEQEVQSLNLAVRGVSSRVVNVMNVEQVDLASAQATASKTTGLVPFFVLLAMVYGAMTAALDTTAGERERGSLEPLVLNPAPPWVLATGKWAAVTLLCVMLTLASCVSFIPSQALIGSEALAASFQIGWREVGWFMLMMTPLCAAFSAVLMAIAVRAATVKEATANATVAVSAVSLVPLIQMMQDGGEKAWHLFAPILGQTAMMQRVVRGEALSGLQIGLPALVCALATVACIWAIGQSMKTQSVR